jgi:hypothetical protein
MTEFHDGGNELPPDPFISSDNSYGDDGVYDLQPAHDAAFPPETPYTGEPDLTAKVESDPETVLQAVQTECLISVQDYLVFWRRDKETTGGQDYNDRTLSTILSDIAITTSLIGDEASARRHFEEVTELPHAPAGAVLDAFAALGSPELLLDRLEDEKAMVRESLEAQRGHTEFPTITDDLLQEAIARRAETGQPANDLLRDYAVSDSRAWQLRLQYAQKLGEGGGAQAVAANSQIATLANELVHSENFTPHFILRQIGPLMQSVDGPTRTALLESYMSSNPALLMDSSFITDLIHLGATAANDQEMTSTAALQAFQSLIPNAARQLVDAGRWTEFQSMSAQLPWGIASRLRAGHQLSDITDYANGQRQALLQTSLQERPDDDRARLVRQTSLVVDWAIGDTAHHLALDGKFEQAGQLTTAMQLRDMRQYVVAVCLGSADTPADKQRFISNVAIEGDGLLDMHARTIAAFINDDPTELAAVGRDWIPQASDYALSAIAGRQMLDIYEQIAAHDMAAGTQFVNDVLNELRGTPASYADYEPLVLAAARRGDARAVQKAHSIITTEQTNLQQRIMSLWRLSRAIDNRLE